MADVTTRDRLWEGNSITSLAVCVNELTEKQQSLSINILTFEIITTIPRFHLICNLF